MFISPRLIFLLYWLFPEGQFKINLAFENSLWPLLGLTFLPWTILVYAILFPLVGTEWAWLGFALLADISGFYGAVLKSRQIPRKSEI